MTLAEIRKNGYFIKYPAALQQGDTAMGSGYRSSDVYENSERFRRPPRRRHHEPADWGRDFGAADGEARPGNHPPHGPAITDKTWQPPKALSR